jgi:hypothetical protein
MKGDIVGLTVTDNDFSVEMSPDGAFTFITFEANGECYILEIETELFDRWHATGVTKQLAAAIANSDPDPD